MVFERIMVPTDGSEYARKAVDKAVELAGSFGSTITAIYVVDTSIIGRIPTASVADRIRERLRTDGREALDHAVRTGAAQGVHVEPRMVCGTPVDAIVAESEGFDLIVMGSLGRSAASELLLGSVAERVVRASSCPVLVVRVENAVS